MNLKSCSEEELLSEIERRKKAKEVLPYLRFEPDLESLKQCIKDYIELVAKDEEDEDDKQWIFETALEAFYGKDIWKWINQRN